MPEGDSIARLAINLRTELLGRTVVSSQFMTGRTALVDLSGRELVGVASVGKHLLMRFSGGVTVHVHLRMDGRLRLRRVSSATRAPSTNRAKVARHHTVRFVIGFGDVELVGQMVPIVDVIPTDQERRVVGHLGPDLCDPDWDESSAETAVANLASRPQRPVIEALLDQRNLAGVGNVWAVESCFLSGVYPWLPVGEVADLRRVVDLEHRLVVSGVRTAGHVTTGDRRRGRTHWVYGRSNEPCRRCGTTISRRPGDDGGVHRDTWWCPSCQPRPESVVPAPTLGGAEGHTGSSGALR